jgi:hypothetical protein
VLICHTNPRSDILAELDFQPSGIENLHKRDDEGIRFPLIIQGSLVSMENLLISRIE